MFEVRVKTADGHEFAPTMFDDLDKAIAYFKIEDELGFMCALYNLK